MCYLEAERGLREPLTKSWCYPSVVGWILILTLVFCTTVLTFSSVQLCIPIWLGIFSCLFTSVLWWWFLPSSICRHVLFSIVVIFPISLKSPFSDQFPSLNLWDVCICTSYWSGVKLFSRQCGNVSRLCFSAKQKINIYWRGSGGFFFCLVTSVSILLQGQGTNRFCFYFESKSLSRYTVFDNWELGCEPLTQMGNKTNGEPQIWVGRTVSQFTIGIYCEFLQRAA